MSVEEALAVVADVNRPGGIKGHMNPHDVEDITCEHCDDLDVLMLAVHVEACNETSGDGYTGPWSYCGADFQIGKKDGKRGQRIPLAKPWYCWIATKYLP